MGKFEIFLLVLGVGLLVLLSQMPTDNLAIAGSSTGTANPQASQRLVLRESGQASGWGEFEEIPVLARFSADAFKVVDGDSIRISTADAGELDLRLAAIDAPELNQAGGQAAKRHLKAITAGGRATFLQTDTDRYQRAVVFMFVDRPNSTGGSVRQQEVNAQMIADGFAWHAIKFSSSDRLTKLEASAKSKRLGLWADANPQPPWEYRGRK